MGRKLQKRPSELRVNRHRSTSLGDLNVDGWSKLRSWVSFEMNYSKDHNYDFGHDREDGFSSPVPARCASVDSPLAQIRP